MTEDDETRRDREQDEREKREEGENKRQRFNCLEISTRLSSVSTRPRMLIDSGASTSATSDLTILTSIKPCTDVHAYPA